tara:strand:+ start:272 stop:550 length:279 start_codon:yes stop_codon:yes gene_type:complete
MKDTIKQRILDYLENHSELSEMEARKRFKIKDVERYMDALREDGYPIQSERRVYVDFLDEFALQPRNEPETYLVYWLDVEPLVMGIRKRRVI